MQKILKALVILLIIASPYSVHAKAETIVSVNDLIEHAKEFDGQEVTVQGEAIGEGMKRGDYSWININDGTNAIGLWTSESDAEKVTRYGNYKNIGDTIQMVGVFHRACKEHGGEADLHGKELTVIEEGYQIKETIAVSKILGSGVLVLIAFAMFLLLYKTTNRKGKIPANYKNKD